MANHTSTVKRNVPIKLALTYMLWNVMAANGLRYSSYLQRIPRRSFLYNDNRNLVSPGLVYGFCDNAPYHNENANETKCTFAMEMNSNVGSPEHVRICNATYRARFDDEHEEWSPYIDVVVAVDKDKAVVSIKNNPGYINTSILHFSDCRLVPIDLGVHDSPEPQAPFDGAFDIVSQKHGSVRTVVDFEGNIIGETRNDVSFLVRTVVHSPLKGHLTVWGNLKGEISLEAFTVEGPELLSRYSINKNPTDSSKLPNFEYASSSTNKLLSMCGANNSTISCVQFDYNGVLKFETTITLAKSSKTYFFNAYNLQGGGLLLVGFRCAREFSHHCEAMQDHATVKKIDNIGREVGTLQIREFPSLPFWRLRDLHFFEYEKKEMCLSSLDQRYYEDNHHKDRPVTVEVVCFKNEELL